MLFFMIYILVNIFSHVRTISCLPGLNQYLVADKMPCYSTQQSDSAYEDSRTSKVSKGAKIRNRYNQIPHQPFDP